VLVDQRWLVFTVTRGSEDKQGLYVHGPIP
jgi:hypothetical protein